MVVTADTTRRFEPFYAEELPRLVPTLHALTGDRSSAEDPAQDALRRAHEHWGEISAYDRPGAWVRRVALNLAANAARGRGREARALQLVAPAAPVELPAADESLEQLPADAGPVVTDTTPVSTIAPEPVPSTDPEPESTVTTTIVEPAFSVATDQVGRDGPGSACLTLDVAVTGCFPGGSISDDDSAPTTAWVLTDDGGGAIDVWIVDGEVAVRPADSGGVPCAGDLPYRTDAWLIGLVCGRGAALWEALPSAPTGPPTPEAVRSTDGGVLDPTESPIVLRPVPSTEWRIYAADLDLGFEARCTRSCRTTSRRSASPTSPRPCGAGWTPSRRSPSPTPSPPAWPTHSVWSASTRSP
jgi:hypothetical protein